MPCQRDKNIEVGVPNPEEENNQGHLKQTRVLLSSIFSKMHHVGHPVVLQEDPGSLAASRQLTNISHSNFRAPNVLFSSQGVLSLHMVHTRKYGPNTHAHRIGKSTASKEQMILRFQWDGFNYGQRDQRQ